MLPSLVHIFGPMLPFYPSLKTCDYKKITYQKKSMKTWYHSIIGSLILEMEHIITMITTSLTQHSLTFQRNFRYKQQEIKFKHWLHVLILTLKLNTMILTI